MPGLALDKCFAEQFVNALEKVDKGCLFEFLRRNEVNLPALLQKFGDNSAAAKEGTN